jgi:2-keto-4-pentenoate hydratase
MTPVSLLFKTIYNQWVSNNKNPIGMRMNPPSLTAEQQNTAQDIAACFFESRRSAQALAEFPGPIPANLELAYQVQDAGIRLTGQPIGGWKVGRIPPDIEDQFGIDRLAGPIFNSTIHEVDSGATTDMPIFTGGFAAVEAEFVAVIAKDAPADKLTWTLDEASAMISDLRIGLEIASSPLATINELGPAVVVSDFGNNFGLIVGPSIRDWQSRSLDTMNCHTYIEDQVAGDGGAFNLTGGFVRSVQFLLELNARRGLPLRAGDLVATGQTTGIHDIVVGQTGTTDFGDDGRLVISAIAAQPLNA